MNNEEIRSTVEQVKAQVKAKPENKDKTDDEIDEIVLDGFLEALDKGEMGKEDLLGIMDLMGYEPTEEFEAELNKGGGPELKEDVTEEDLKGARTIGKEDDEDNAEDFKKNIEELKSDEDEDEDEIDDNDEDAQRRAASKLFKMDFTK